MKYRYRLKNIKNAARLAVLAFVASITVATALAPQAGAVGSEIGSVRSISCNSRYINSYFPGPGTRNVSYAPGNFCLVKNQFMAIFQTDGNFVVYNNGRPVWASGTNGRYATRLTFQSDGNLVIYRDYTPLWNTATYLRVQARVLVMQSDGNLVIYAPDGRTPYWSTWTGLI